MTSLVHSARGMWNPALGAALIWRFASSYGKQASESEAVPLLLFFLVLPVTFHRRMAEVAKKTNRPSGLRKFAEKFTGSADSRRDELAALHERCARLRSLTLEAIGLAASAGMLEVDFDRATITANGWKGEKDVPESVRSMLQAAARLGYWCSDLSVADISATLKVAF